MVTGDTDFAGDEAIAYYEDALDEVVKRAPEALRTMHINRANRTIPAQYLDRLDFYMFQPGHNYEGQPEAWRLPQDFIANYPKSRWSTLSLVTSRWVRRAMCTGASPCRIAARAYGRRFLPAPVPA